MTSNQFHNLYVQQSGKLYFWILGRAKNKAVAEDVVARAFLLAWERRAQLNGNAQAWLYAIAKNVLNSFQRHASYLQMEPLEDHTEHPDPRDFTEELAKFYEVQRIAHAADLLDGAARKVLACHVQGMSQEETAKSLGVPAGTAASRLSRAKQELRELCAA